MGLARHKITGRRKFHGMRATSSPCFVLPYPLQRSWRLQSGAFPISKIRQAGSLTIQPAKKLFVTIFLPGLPPACVARGGGREPDKRRSVRRTISARRPTTREEKVRRDGSQRGQEVKRKTRGLSVWWPTKRCRSTQKSGEARLQDDGL